MRDRVIYLTIADEAEHWNARLTLMQYRTWRYGVCYADAKQQSNSTY